MPSPRPIFLKRIGRPRISDPVLALALGLAVGAILGYFGI